MKLHQMPPLLQWCPTSGNGKYTSNYTQPGSLYATPATSSPLSFKIIVVSNKTRIPCDFQENDGYPFTHLPWTFSILVYGDFQYIAALLLQLSEKSSSSRVTRGRATRAGTLYADLEGEARRRRRGGEKNTSYCCICTITVMARGCCCTPGCFVTPMRSS